MEGVEEAVRKWMINPKTAPHSTTTGRMGIMGDMERVIVGEIIRRMLCITWRANGEGGTAPRKDL